MQHRKDICNKEVLTSFTKVIPLSKYMRFHQVVVLSRAKWARLTIPIKHPAS